MQCLQRFYMYDRVHPDNLLKDRWFSVVCTSIKMRSTVLISHRLVLMMMTVASALLLYTDCLISDTFRS